jgi:hypothetical protein
VWAEGTAVTEMEVAMARPKSAFAREMDEWAAAMRAELIAEEREKRARRAEISRANLVRARAARQAQRQTAPAPSWGD